MLGDTCSFFFTCFIWSLLLPACYCFQSPDFSTFTTFTSLSWCSSAAWVWFHAAIQGHILCHSSWALLQKSKVRVEKMSFWVPLVQNTWDQKYRIISVLQYLHMYVEIVSLHFDRELSHDVRRGIFHLEHYQKFQILDHFGFQMFRFRDAQPVLLNLWILQWLMSFKLIVQRWELITWAFRMWRELNWFPTNDCSKQDPVCCLCHLLPVR